MSEAILYLSLSWFTSLNMSSYIWVAFYSVCLPWLKSSLILRDKSYLIMMCLSYQCIIRFGLLISCWLCLLLCLSVILFCNFLLFSIRVMFVSLRLYERIPVSSNFGSARKGLEVGLLWRVRILIVNHMGLDFYLREIFL